MTSMCIAIADLGIGSLHDPRPDKTCLSSLLAFKGGDQRMLTSGLVVL